MSLNKKKLERLAKILAGIHSHSLAPFYQGDFAQNFWSSLSEKTDNKEEVDKQFFRSIARHIDESLDIDSHDA
jgi:gamma-glutamyltranspeptidase